MASACQALRSTLAAPPRPEGPEVRLRSLSVAG